MNWTALGKRCPTSMDDPSVVSSPSGTSKLHDERTNDMHRQPSIVDRDSLARMMRVAHLTTIWRHPVASLMASSMCQSLKIER
jgi:hypothetical protein